MIVAVAARGSENSSTGSSYRSHRRPISVQTSPRRSPGFIARQRRSEGTHVSLSCLSPFVPRRRPEPSGLSRRRSRVRVPSLPPLPDKVAATRLNFVRRLSFAVGGDAPGGRSPPPLPPAAASRATIRLRSLRSGPEARVGHSLEEAVAPIRCPVLIDELVHLVEEGREVPAFLHRCRHRILGAVALHAEELTKCPGVLLG